MKDKVCVITGANCGVGYEAALAFARLGAHVVLLCRRHESGEAAVTRIRVDVAGARLELAVADLASLRQVRHVAEALCPALPAIHLLVNNAGVYRARREITEDGLEHTFAVNHLGHFLLTHLLMPSLLRGAARVINVSSGAHRHANLRRAPLEEIMRGTGPYLGIRSYADSKLANILFTRELARRQEANTLCAVALHPGVLATQIWNRNRDPASLFALLFKPFMGHPSVGADAVAFLAREARAKIHGAYYRKRMCTEPHANAKDPAVVRELWKVSSELVGLPAEP